MRFCNAIGKAAYRSPKERMLSSIASKSSETEDNIIQDRSGRYRVKAVTEISNFNEILGTQFSDEDYDTVGGLVVSKFGHLPKRGEHTIFDGLKFQVLRADSRRLHTLLVEKMPQEV